eukprot:PITA_04038
MKINLKPDVKPVKQRPYRLNPKDKEKVCLELDKMLATSIIEPVEESHWAIFSCVVIVAFKEFIHKFLEVYFDDWTVFGLVKCHVACLHLMLDMCRRYQITLNLKKCLFCVPFGILLGHVVYSRGLMVDLAKIAVIINLEVPRSVKQLRATLGHIGYYQKFIKGYAQITMPMEKLLKKDPTFFWDEECQQSLDVLKEKMVIAPILIFPDWKKEFHVHVDASWPDHLSCIETGEDPTNLEEGLPDAQLFVVRVADKHFADIIHFLTTRMALEGILVEAHGEVVGGHYAGKETSQNILRLGLWWPTLHKDSKAYCRACNACQRTSGPLQRDEIPLNPRVLLQPFEKWAIDFVGVIQPPGKKTGAWYIIIAIKYLTRWVEAQPVKDCTRATTTKFLFEYVLTRFGCPKILMSDRSTHFLNETINALIEEFQVYHQKSMPYHPQDNMTVEASNKIL